MGNTKAGYEYLLAYKLTVPIYDYTVVFCNRHRLKLSSARTFDQMVQAARSGMQNILEGWKQQSLASYIKLAGVASGSLEELLKDFSSYARQNNIPIWDREKVKRDCRENRELWEILTGTPTLPTTPTFPTLPTNPEAELNLLVYQINSALYTIDKLIISLKDKHMKEGGFTENLLKKRLDYRHGDRL